MVLSVIRFPFFFVVSRRIFLYFSMSQLVMSFRYLPLKSLDAWPIVMAGRAGSFRFCLQYSRNCSEASSNVTFGTFLKPNRPSST